MSRLYTERPARSVSSQSTQADEVSARQQARVLAWVVGSVVAMHLLVAVGVLWLAQAQGKAQGSAQAQRVGSGSPVVTQPDASRSVPVQPEAVRVPESFGQPLADRVVPAAAVQPTAHWSASVSKDRPAPWRFDANGHVVTGR
jgi:hypothetical protein